MSTPQAGDAAPPFTLPRHDGQTVSHHDFAGHNLVLYFFPKSDTSGCTAEAIAFTTLKADFDAANTAILGVSADTPKKQAAFRTKYSLTFDLAADEEHRLLEPYGVWVQKSMYGRKYWGIERATFLIDGSNKIVRVWRNVKVPGHAAEVLAAARQLNGN